MSEELERESLRRIKKLYGAFITEAATGWHHRPEVLAGIMQRESEGGFSKLLDQPGPEGRGDKDKDGIYHGHGLCQIDDRWHKNFIDSGSWRDGRENILYGAQILAQKRRFLKVKTIGFAIPDDELERAWIAAYNAGEGRVLKCLQQKEDPDICTAHGNYAREVLRLAELYRLIAAGANS